MPIRTWDKHDFAPNRLVASGSIAATQNDLTVEKKTGLIDFNPQAPLSPKSKYLIQIAKGINNSAGDMTFNIYNRTVLNLTATSTTKADFRRGSIIVAKFNDTATYTETAMEGLFIGSDQQITIGQYFATDTGGGTTVYYNIYRL